MIKNTIQTDDRWQMYMNPAASELLNKDIDYLRSLAVASRGRGYFESIPVPEKEFMTRFTWYKYTNQPW